MPDASWSSELAALLDQLQKDAIWLALGLLFTGGLTLLGGPGQFSDPRHRLLAAGAFFGLVLIGWNLRHWRRQATLWVLALGSLTAVVLATAWTGYDATLCLLVFPAGLATLTLGAPAGIALGVASSLLLALAPSSLLPADAALRWLSGSAMWISVSMILLTMRPLLSAVQWAWSGYEQNSQLLEQARDQQGQLKQALEDLGEANVHLSRLNEQAHALRQLAEDERRTKEQFVANVSHELRTPLNMIIGFCELITRAPDTYGARIPPALLADLAVVLRNSKHLANLVDDVLDLSQIEAGRVALTKERVELAEIIEAATIAVRPLYESKGLYLKTSIAADLPAVLCDRTRIREVVLNLLSNAGRFTEQGGVTVEAQRVDDEVRVSVSDTGPGIASEAQDRLFEPFQQSDNSIRRRYGGTGLGLSISKRFVELHDGKMWVESQAGAGATFFFRLPIDPPGTFAGDALRWFNPYQPYEERPRRAPLRTVAVHPRLVVVERGESMQRLLKRYMDGIEVVAATELVEGIRLATETPAQALLINDLGADHTLQRLKESAPLPYGTPTLICSMPGIEEAAGGLGAADYLVKPIAREVLLAALDRLPRPITTVLVADDEPDAQQLFGRMLIGAERGYQVLRALDGWQALDILRRLHPDVILLDLMMPEMDGFQLLAAKNQDPALREIPVILISARDPLGQPIVSNTLTVTCPHGLSAQELLESVQALTAILARTSPGGRQVLTTKLPG
jgi:signal transduction histidine kinase/CheY-like chemotaxis protein